MGQWATRRRRGAGTPADIYITDITVIDLGNGIFVLTYSGDITAAWFGQNVFILQDITPSVSVAQNSSDSLVVDFATDAIGTDFIHYTGNAPNVRPQQIKTFA